MPAGSRTGWCAGCALEKLLQEGGLNAGGGLSLRDIPGAGAKISYIGDYEIIEIIGQGGMGVVYQIGRAHV